MLIREYPVDKVAVFPGIGRSNVPVQISDTSSVDCYSSTDVPDNDRPHNTTVTYLPDDLEGLLAQLVLACHSGPP